LGTAVFNASAPVADASPRLRQSLRKLARKSEKQEDKGGGQEDVSCMLPRCNFQVFLVTIIEKINAKMINIIKKIRDDGIQ
jgi:hypothetical protein